jgi:glutamate dehydrogenase/leucine dehydrogenase
VNSSRTTLAAPEPASRLPLTSYGQAQAQFNRLAERLRLDAATRDLLRHPLREHRVRIPVRMDDGSTRVVGGVRVQHINARGPFKGGAETFGLAEQESLFLRDAAYLLAIERVAAACRQRGWV